MRVYKKKVGGRQYKNWSNDDIEAALHMVRDGASIHEAAKRYNIRRSTISRRIRGITDNKNGGQTTLTAEEETELAGYVLLLAQWSFPITTFELGMLVKNNLDSRGKTAKRFTNNTPGDDWARSFLARHKTALSTRMANNVKSTRAQVSREEMDAYFKNLEKSLEGVPPQNIFNYDETNLSDDPGKKKVIAKRGLKYVDRIVNHSKSATSLMFCGSASGELLPPYVVYKAENLWTTWSTHAQGPKGTKYNKTKHGWFDASSFHDWFKLMLIPHLRKLSGVKVVIGDNLSSHFSENVLKLAQQNQIRFVCLPPNSTHLCQPLDVAFFPPLKIAWRQILNDFKNANRRVAGIPKDVFPALLKQLFAKITPNAVKNLTNGFAACGIYPFAPNRVLQKLPSKIVEENEASQNSVDSPVPYGSRFFEIPKKTFKEIALKSRSYF